MKNYQRDLEEGLSEVGDYHIQEIVMAQEPSEESVSR